MQTPVQITFRDMSPSDAIREACLAEAEELEQVFDRLTSCRVTVGKPHAHSRSGQLFAVQIDVVLPGTELVVRREPREHQEDGDVYVVLRDAFRCMQRRLQDHVDRIRPARPRSHAAPEHGRVTTLKPDLGFGFLTALDGREIYFHRNSVLGHGGFDSLELGVEVAFAEEQGDEGPQASTVTPVGRHHHNLP